MSDLAMSARMAMGARPDRALQELAQNMTHTMLEQVIGNATPSMRSHTTNEHTSSMPPASEVTDAAPVIYGNVLHPLDQAFSYGEELESV